MRKTSGRTLAVVSLAAVVAVGCSSPMGSNGATGGAASTGTATNASAAQDAGGAVAMAPLRCAPSEGMVDACSDKASGDACALLGRGDGGWSLPGSCRSTFDGTGLACVPTPAGPPGFLVNACSGKALGGACTVTGPTGPGVCRTGPTGAMACRPASLPGSEACAGLDAGAACTLGFGHKPREEGLSGNCVVPAAGGAATCLVSCTDLFHKRHHHHGFGSNGRGGPQRGTWWKHGPADAGTASP